MFTIDKNSKKEENEMKWIYNINHSKLLIIILIFIHDQFFQMWKVLFSFASKGKFFKYIWKKVRIMV
jgi:hypothetical protein